MKTIKVTPEEMGRRTARFKDLVPYSKQHSGGSAVPMEVMEKLTAHRVYSIMAPANYVGRSAMAPIKSVPGAVISIAECPPGDGPGLHCHETTVENFFCLSGRFELQWGDNGEDSMILEPLDFVSVPPGVSRRFVNISEEIGRLFVVIQPSGEQQDRVAYAPVVGTEIESAYGTGVLNNLKDLGFKFDAGVESEKA
ncbi:cupin domain-containing protein [Paraburkholderia sp. CNPSo 3274]|uniref:cupin domain-containing protein n=1 Tax=Paraburkholderia sp. CNPSo 3274 TaxID=2940932 RepID=UPI0020B76D4E|nr:cupin domain-containing protein [Paraburkholderia sp. CNPSo 3274]MCP3712711.1 cupin domain-containing protein [Paraburkholderia sp. CNPSo 3274]